MGPGRPHFHQPPLPPRKPGLSPLAIVLIVLGVVLVVGAGSCLVIGGLLVIGASAAPDPATTDASPTGAQTTSTPSGTTTPTTKALAPDEAPPAATGTTAASPTIAGTAPTATAAAAGTWTCNASGSVRVCGFANVCNNQIVFGSGFGKDRFLANSQAKNACEGMARAKGGSTVCVVQCTLK